MTLPETASAATDKLPIHSFSRCHAGIRAQLDLLAQLPQQAELTPQTRDFARQTLQTFRTAMFDHHGEEEKELFPAVLAASNASEYGALRSMADALTAEHRQIEAVWNAIEPALEQLALGNPVLLDDRLVQDLVTRYAAHAQSEEEQFLPLAETVLGRRDPAMAALGLSLHMRHQLRAAERSGVFTPSPASPRTA